jgi:hypothetical protein
LPFCFVNKHCWSCQEMEATCNVIVEDNHCAYFDQVDKLKNYGAHNKETVSSLLWAFFHYWAYQHDYMQDVISIRTGRIIRYVTYILIHPFIPTFLGVLNFCCLLGPFLNLMMPSRVQQHFF